MSSFKPEVHAFVEEFVFSFLHSITNSKDLEDRYRSLTYQVKSSSTNELRKIAKRYSNHILKNTANLAALLELGDDDLIYEALMQAINNNDQ